MYQLMSPILKMNLIGINEELFLIEIESCVRNKSTLKLIEYVQKIVLQIIYKKFHLKTVTRKKLKISFKTFK